jgi:MYXO-CTERM domain-containing protein
MSTNGTTPGTTPSTPEEIEADIARQREQLATTVNDLQARLDVKTRTKHKVAELRGRATTADGRPTPQVMGGAAAALAVVVGLVLLRRRHR